VALTTLAAGAAPAAAATLSGPSRLHVLQQVTYRATGLPAGSYALLIERTSSRGARCTAHLAARRQASGVELFHGSLPDGLQCVRGSQQFSTGVRPGAYRVLVRAVAGNGRAVAGRSVRVVG